MAKTSVVQRNLKRINLVKSCAKKRATLKSIAYNRSLPLQERFEAQLALSEMPRDASPVRVRNRCLITGRGRGYYRKFKMSRICIREYAAMGALPGVVKSSW